MIYRLSCVYYLLLWLINDYREKDISHWSILKNLTLTSGDLSPKISECDLLLSLGVCTTVCSGICLTDLAIMLTIALFTGDLARFSESLGEEYLDHSTDIPELMLRIALGIISLFL